MVEAAPKGSVVIVGAGTQGRRLAYMWSSKGSKVHLIDAQPEQLHDSVKFIDKLRRQLDQSDVTHSQIETHTPDTLKIALAEAWLVVECVPERLDLKRKILSQLDEQAPKSTIVASNSSSYTISEIIRGLNLTNEHHVLSAHSYWPPETPVIEIMGHSTTDPACISRVLQESRLHGFEPYHVKRESMGYIYNRIWAAIKREALLVAAEGVAEPAEVDAVFKAVLKTAKGPFEQMDVVGLDVVLDIEEHYAARREDVAGAELSREAREFLKVAIREGRLGVKNGRGFYSYDADGLQVDVH